MRKALSDILHHGDRERLQDAWNSTEAADDYGTPLPPAEYVCHLMSCELFNARSKGTPGVKLVFKILEGDHAGRRLWHDCWLTEAAMPQSKRDLGKLGITTMEQLERPLPPGIRCSVKVAIRKDDDGTEYNRVKRFDVVGLDEPEADAFAPSDTPSPPAPLPQMGEGSDCEPPAGVAVDTTFDPAKLNAEAPAGGDNDRF